MNSKWIVKYQHISSRANKELYKKITIVDAKSRIEAINIVESGLLPYYDRFTASVKRKFN